jgi:hypothetical protein
MPEPKKTQVVAAFVMMAALSSVLIPSLSLNLTNHAINFADALNEGLLRCTNGKLVSTQDQCPDTDQCPPPQNTSVANCIPAQISNSGINASNQENKPGNETKSGSECFPNRATLHTPQCPVKSTSSNSSNS